MDGLKDTAKLIAAGIGAFLLFGFCGLMFLRWDFDRGYSMKPSSFREQMKSLSPCMTKEEVKSRITGYTKVRETENKLVFVLQAKDSDGIILPRIGQYINV